MVARFEGRQPWWRNLRRATSRVPCVAIADEERRRSTNGGNGTHGVSPEFYVTSDARTVSASFESSSLPTRRSNKVRTHDRLSEDDPMGPVRISFVVGLFAVQLLSVPPVGPRMATAQPVNERTPNLAGTWVTSPRNLYFEFSHRFQVVGTDKNIADIFGDGKIVNYPTFDLAYGLVRDVMLGFAYSPNSPVGTIPNEWQPFVRWAPRPQEGPGRLSVSIVTAYNGAAKSLDGELSGQIQLGPVIALSAARGFSNAFDKGEAALALGGGLGLRVNRYITLEGDVNGIVAGLSGFETPAAWSAALALGIPYTPHTFSLLVTNVRSGTLEGTSVGVTGTAFWGFEFTVPFSGFARWGKVLSPDEVEEEGAGARLPEDAVVEVEIRGFAFQEQVLRIPVGTTVRWLNRDPVGHTSTAREGEWGSPLIGPGETYEVTFSEQGRFEYYCQPHPFMTAEIVVLPARTD